MLGTLYGDLVACSYKQNGGKFGDELDVVMFRFPKGCMDHYGEVINRLREIDQDYAIRRRIEVELVATHSFGD